MKAKYFLILVFVATFTLISCKKIDGGGTIKVQGATTYMYGTHTIDIQGTTYAIKSSHVNLDDYADQYVTIHAEKVEGYPIDSGPMLLEVMSVE